MPPGTLTRKNPYPLLIVFAGTFIALFQPKYELLGETNVAISIDKAIGIHDDALTVRARRAELLASNLANADTPHYKARDIDFRAALSQAQQNQHVGMRVTHASHLQGEATAATGEALYRMPAQPSLDGNTVDAQAEHTAFTENAVQYEASLMFLNRRISSLRSILKGE